MHLRKKDDEKVLEKIRVLLEGVEFGLLQIIIHDSQVTQIDKLEKHRLPKQNKNADRTTEGS
ncbi:YezD family protein [Peribacillus sp. SCS-37]|uniref:YezD family protein n=1 Tax=Paraperibacillus esterisolvens TaxID=3115296 RepID=UPI003906B455